EERVDEIYDYFVQVSVDGRGMGGARGRELADGRVYTGKQAKENNLTDEVGTFEDTLTDLQTTEGVEDAQVFEYNEKQVFLSAFMQDAQNIFKSEESQLVELITSLEHAENPRVL